MISTRKNSDGRENYWVLEFNARFGDPEAQVLLPRLAPEENFYTLCVEAATGALNGDRMLAMKSESAVYVVGAARGYPENPVKGAVYGVGI